MAKTIWVELLGAEVKLIQGPRFRSRILEAGREHAETLILTHPGGGHVESFAYNIVPLGQHIHTVGMEMLWHGFSDTPPIGEDRVARDDAVMGRAARPPFVPRVARIALEASIGHRLHQRGRGERRPARETRKHPSPRRYRNAVQHEFRRGRDPDEFRTMLHTVPRPGNAEPCRITPCGR